MRCIRLAAGAALGFGIFAGAMTGVEAQDACPDSVKLGTTVSDTGPFAPLGSGWHEMIEVFEDEFNKAGGVNLADCGKKVPVEILIYDDQSNPATAVSLFERMASQDGVDFFVGPDWSSLGLAVSAVAERNAIPIVMGNVAAPSAYRDGQEYVFGTPSPIVPLWSERYFEMLETVEPKPETFFFIIQDNPVTAAISNFWMKKAEEKSYKIVGTETFPSDLKDFTSVVLKIRQARPDVVYITSFDNASVPLVQQLRQLRVKAMDVHHIMLSGALAKQVGSDIEGMTGEISWIESVDTPDSAFAADVMRKAGVDPFSSVFAVGRYTTVPVMLQAI